MDKISAACAMGWSIELEKGLRSRKPDHPIESVHNIGPRLEQWSREPQLTMAVCDMFGLVPGEDRLFADAILLRLADAYVSGNKDTRVAIIKVFLPTLRHRKTNNGQAHRVFSNMSMENRLELLRKVKVVLSTKCVESKALTLVLFGCWADVAKDIAEIRLAILSTLTSCHILEVKAALFAAKCFAGLSDDFGSVFLERLLHLMTSPKTSPGLKVAGARAFSKLDNSILLANKSYKVGVELLRKGLEEEVLAAMLVSLTKISSKVGILISEQVDLLNSFLAQNPSSHMQATILRCMRYIAERPACLVPVRAFPFISLFKMFDEPSTPSALRCEVLQIFLKMIAYVLPGVPLMDIDEFIKLLRYVEDATRSQSLSERLLAFEVLVCICNKMKGQFELMSGDNSVTFLSGVVSTVSDQMTRLMSMVSGGTESSEIEHEVRSLLKLLLALVENHSELGYFILDKLHLAIESMVNSHISAVTVMNSEVHKVVNTGGEENKFSTQMLMFDIHRFLVAFLEILDEAGVATNQVVLKLKHLGAFVCKSSLFSCSIHAFYALLLHTHVNSGCLLSEEKNDINYVQSPGKLFEYEALIHECAGNMLTGGDNWRAYRAAKYAACEGAWYVANFFFENLETRVQSDFRRQWLRFLVQFTHSERTAQVLLQQEWRSSSSDHRVTVSGEYNKKLADVCDEISSLDKVLEAISIPTQTLCFQRWFLGLRVKVLHALVDMLNILNTYPFCNDGVESNTQPRESGRTLLFQQTKDMMSSLVRVSSRLIRLAEEYDLVASSFIDMDSKSFKVISSIAFSCSLLAFCTGFANLIGNSSVLGNTTKISHDGHFVLAQDLAGRLWHTDSETCMNLMALLKDHGVQSSLHLLSRFQISKVGRISKDILTVYRASAEGIIRVQKESLSFHCEDTISQVLEDGMRLLLNVVEAWMHIPFRVPKYFFRVRPSIGSVLISSSARSQTQNEIFVSSGSHLALNLCIQLKNMPSDICSRFSEIHCILYCKSSNLVTINSVPNEQIRTGYQASSVDNMIDLNKKLQWYVMKQTREFINHSHTDLNRDGEVVERHVVFETNGRTQGFSTCLLDVSGFPLGSYRVQWHSCGVDSQGAYWSILPLSQGPVFTVTVSNPA